MMDYRFGSAKRKRIILLHLVAVGGALGAAIYTGWLALRAGLGMIGYGFALITVALLVLALALACLFWVFGRLRYRLSAHMLLIKAGGFVASLPLADTTLTKLERLAPQIDSLTQYDWGFWTHYPLARRPLALVHGDHYCLISPQESKQFRALYYRLQKIEATDEGYIQPPEGLQVEARLRLRALWAGESIWRRLGGMNLLLWVALGAGVMYALEKLPRYTVLLYELGRGIMLEGPRTDLLWLWALLGLVGIVFWVLSLFLRRHERFAAQLLLLSYSGIVLLAAVYLITLLLFVG